jgi:hypothetical protein
MRSADPAAYDQFIEITSNTTTNTKFGTGFRAILVTATGDTTGAVTLVIEQLVNGTLASKSVDLRVNRSSTIFPISGETVYCSSVTTAKIYALI